MSDYETAGREIFKAADAFCEASTPEQAERLSHAIHKNVLVLEGYNKVHESCMRTNQQLIDA